MGNQSTVPRDSPLGYILSNWKKSDPDALKKKRLTLCNMAWPHYKAGNGEVWPGNGTIKFNTLLQLDLFCCSQGKWMEDEASLAQCIFSIYTIHYGF